MTIPPNFKFGDAHMPASSDDIRQLRNLGPVSAQWLRDSEISTRSALEQFGPIVAYCIVKRRVPNASLNLLWALAAGLLDKDWRELTVAEKDKLRHQYLELRNSRELTSGF